MTYGQVRRPVVLRAIRLNKVFTTPSPCYSRAAIAGILKFFTAKTYSIARLPTLVKISDWLEMIYLSSSFAKCRGLDREKAHPEHC